METNLIPSYVAVPASAQYLVPEPRLIFSGKGKGIQRFLFTGQVFSEFEDEKLKRLEIELKNSKIDPYKLHPTWTRNDLLRFCYGTGWKTRVAKEVILKYLKWHQATMPAGYLSLYPRVSELFKSGCLYIHGRDIYYRPILVINFNRFNFKKVEIQEYIYMVAFFLDYVIENMLLPGKVENWIVITDFEKSGLSDLGFGPIKQVMGVLTDYYRCRLGCNYILNPSKTVYYIWSCLKPFLDDVLIEKVKILNKGIPDEIFLHCNPYQIEEKYGGKSKNVEVYWPPTMPCAPYTLDGIPLEEVKSDIDHIEKSCEFKEETVEKVFKENEVNHDNQLLENSHNPIEIEESQEKIELDNLESKKRERKLRRKEKRRKKEEKRQKREEVKVPEIIIKREKKVEKEKKNNELIEETKIIEKEIKDSLSDKTTPETDNFSGLKFSENIERGEILVESHSKNQYCAMCTIVMDHKSSKCQLF